MTMDYYIIVGHRLSQNDQEIIEDLIASTFNEIDTVYNKWNPTSEVSKLNRLKAGEIVSLSPELENFLFLTDDIVKLTQGKFDPTIEPIQQLWKNHLKKGEIPSDIDIQSLLPAIGWHHLHFGDGKFFKDHDATSLDLGGIAKGYCVDLLVEKIVQAGFNHVFVEWGGEIRAHGLHPDNRPWNIVATFSDEIDSQHELAHVSLYNQAVATSGDYIQRWTAYKDGFEITFFHIIDPTTGTPLIATRSSVATATVIAPTCVLADALATVAMMYPSLNEARQWAEGLSYSNQEINFWLFSREEIDCLQVSEEEGFEPPLPLRVNLFSKQTHSAALPLFLAVG